MSIVTDTRLAGGAAAALFGLSALLAGTAAQAQDCVNRGQLDVMYCDANEDLVADTPSDPSKLSNPDTLVFAYTPVEDPAIYEDIWEPSSSIWKR
ncbi:phosphonate-binding periplasmic protein [Nitratireductor aquibiodomus RA22]|uniref:Phosphonate-binding periplasmic protein n=1 Tax=Nitratireductor aquibiodomus RA22 TaxID=1189611 RepID=I5BQW9_9HYPH|nr:hypothetical protein [Nitratireductor aquibiodomus]EIM71971.1 phosphonate-binding periplasmic protein [Nitratireductor aquibiodomus RA22]